MTNIETSTKRRSGALLAAMLFAFTAIAAAAPGILGPGMAEHDPLAETITITLTTNCPGGNTFLDPLTDIFWCGGTDTAVLELGPAAATSGSGILARECSYRAVTVPEQGPNAGEWLSVATGALFQPVSCAATLELTTNAVYQYKAWVATNDGNEHTEIFLAGYDVLAPATPVIVTGCADRYDATGPDRTACSSGLTADADVQKPFPGAAPEFGAPLLTSECRYQGAIVGCPNTQVIAAHGITAFLLKGEDVLGNTALRGHQLIVDLLPPVVQAKATCSIYLSGEGWCRTQITPQATAFALSGIQSIECEVQAFGEPPVPVPCNQPFTEEGLWELRVRATSNVNRVSGWATAPFQIDTTRPDGFFLSPQPGCSYILGQELCTGGPAIAYGVVPVEYFAEDPAPANGRPHSGIRQVEFRDQGYVIKRMFPGDDVAGVFSFGWDVTKAPAAGTSFQFGERTLEVRVHDQAGNSRIDSITVTVPVPPLLP